MPAPTPKRRPLTRALLLFAATTAAAHAQVVGGTITGVGHGRHRRRSSPTPQVLVHNDDTGTEPHASPPTPPAALPLPPSPSAPTLSTPPLTDGFAPYRRNGISLTIGQSTRARSPSPSPSAAVDRPGHRRRTTPPPSISQHAANLRPRRRPPGQGAPSQWPLLRPAHHPQPRHRQLHRRSAPGGDRYLQLFGRQHVLRLRPPSAGQSLPA